MRTLISSSSSILILHSNSAPLSNANDLDSGKPLLPVNRRHPGRRAGACTALHDIRNLRGHLRVIRMATPLYTSRRLLPGSSCPVLQLIISFTEQAVVVMVLAVAQVHLVEMSLTAVVGVMMVVVVVMVVCASTGRPRIEAGEIGQGSRPAVLPVAQVALVRVTYRQR